MQELANEGLTSQAVEEDTAYQKFRHSGWQRLRARVRNSLVRTGVPADRLHRFDICGTGCYLWHSPSAEALALRGNFCKNRSCIPCMNARALQVQHNVAAYIQRKHVRFLTFTLKQNGNESLKQMLDRLHKSLTLLYRRDEWKQHVTGWARFIEIKRGARFHGWHVHAHILAEGSFWQQSDMSTEWHAVTGDSMITDIRAVTDPAGGAYYAAKYSTKGSNLHDLDNDADLDEVIQETHHRRLSSVHGTWKGKLKLFDRPPATHDWHCLGSIDTIITMSANGDIGMATLFQRFIEQTKPRIAPRPPPRA